MKFKIVEIECERAIGCAPNQLADLINQRWPSITSEAHDFVLVLIHLETEIGGERRIQHSQGMRKSDFTEAPDCCRAVCGTFAVADRKRRPLAYRIGRQNRGPTGRRREKCGGSVRLVMLGKQDLAPGHTQMRRNNSPHPDFFAK